MKKYKKATQVKIKKYSHNDVWYKNRISDVLPLVGVDDEIGLVMVEPGLININDVEFINN